MAREASAMMQKRETSIMHEDLGDDVEGLIEERSVRVFSPPGFTMTRVALIALGALALVACITTAASSLRSSASRPHTARSVLESRELADVATDNIMQAGHLMLGEEQRDNVRAKASTYFHGVASRLQEHDPRALEALEQIKMNDEQKGATLRALASLTDPRVQRLGLYVAKGVRESPNEDRESLERGVKEQLWPHRHEIRQLHDELRLDSLRELSAAHMDLDSHRIQILKTMGSNWELEFSATAPVVQQDADDVAERQLQTVTGSPLHKADEGFAIIKLLADQARTMLDIVKGSAKMFGQDLNVNTWITTALGLSDLVFGMTSCELDGADHKSGLDMMKMVLCPLESGSAGMDAMRWLLGFAGVLGDNNPANGEQGNHAGEESHGFF